MDAIWLKVPEAAAKLGLGRSKLYELIAAGELDTVRVGRAVRVPARAIEEFAARVEAEAETRRPHGAA